MDYGKYRQKLQQNSVVAGNEECLLWTGYTRARGGVLYGQINVKINNKWTCMHAHRLSVICSDQILVPANLDVSHLCHNGLCINRAHLVLEPHSVNNARKTCINTGECKGHLQYPGCMLHLKLQ